MITLPRIALVGRPERRQVHALQPDRAAAARPSSTPGRGPRATGTTPRPRGRARPSSSIDTGGLLLQSDDPLLGPASDQAERAIARGRPRRARGGRPRRPHARRLRHRASACASPGKTVMVAVNKVEGKDDVLNEFTRAGVRPRGRRSPPSTASASATCSTRRSPQVPAGGGRRGGGAAAAARASSAGRTWGSRRSSTASSARSARSSPTIAGTTRDGVDGLLEKNGKKYLFVDTAGIRPRPPPEGERRPRERGAGAARRSSGRTWPSSCSTPSRGCARWTRSSAGYVAGGGAARS